MDLDALCEVVVLDDDLPIPPGRVGALSGGGDAEAAFYDEDIGL
jgi:hypothetical protein